MVFEKIFIRKVHDTDFSQIRNRIEFNRNIEKTAKFGELKFSRNLGPQ